MLFSALAAFAAEAIAAPASERGPMLARYWK